MAVLSLPLCEQPLLRAKGSSRSGCGHGSGKAFTLLFLLVCLGLGAYLRMLASTSADDTQNQAAGISPKAVEEFSVPMAARQYQQPPGGSNSRPVLAPQPGVARQSPALAGARSPPGDPQFLRSSSSQGFGVHGRSAATAEGDGAHSSDTSAEVRGVYAAAVEAFVQWCRAKEWTPPEIASALEEDPVEEAAVSVGLALHPGLRQDAVLPVLQVILSLPQLQLAGGQGSLIGIIGIPGAGKSVTSDLLAHVLGFACMGKDEAAKTAELLATAPGDWRPATLPVLGMDGYHIPLARLKAEQGAHGVYWRGAPETFDKDILSERLAEIRNFLRGASASADNAELSATDFAWPSFDHAVGDPRPNAVTIQRGKPAIVEGNYLLHWPEVADLLDVVVLLDNLSVDEAVERLKVRNACIPGYTKEEIEKRCDEVDRKNAEVVLESMKAFKAREGQIVVRIKTQEEEGESGSIKAKLIMQMDENQESIKQ